MMNAKATQTRWLARRPLSIFGKLTVAGLLAAAISSGILAIALRYPSGLALLIVTVILLIGAGGAAIGFRWLRWAPLLVALLSGLFLYQLLFRVAYVTYHLTNPKTGGFFFFVMDVLIVTGAFLAFGASVGAAIENYWRKAQRSAGMRRSASAALVAGAAGLCIGAIFIAALAQAPAPTGLTYTNGVPTVHMSDASFTPSSVTIAKGSQLLLMDDTSVTHILANGSWSNGTATPAEEAGAPTVRDVQVHGGSVTIGPFTTAGVYHIYCIVHPGMNLTITVQ